MTGWLWDRVYTTVLYLERKARSIKLLSLQLYHADIFNDSFFKTIVVISHPETQELQNDQQLYKCF